MKKKITHKRHSWIALIVDQKISTLGSNTASFKSKLQLLSISPIGLATLLEGVNNKFFKAKLEKYGI